MPKGTGKSRLSSTQIGAIAENVVANELMVCSDGRLSPFKPIADDGGIDLLVYDKLTGKGVPLQVKARTNTLKKHGSESRSNIVHFEVRKASIKDDRYAYLLCVLLDSELQSVRGAWLLSMREFKRVAAERSAKFVIRANQSPSSQDKYAQFRLGTLDEVAKRICDMLDE